MRRSLTSISGSAATTVAPEFLVTPDLLDAISPPGDSGGMVLGCSNDSEPLSVSVLRPQPTRLVVVGGLYLARHIALRAMAAGAWLVIATGRPAAWQVLSQAAGHGPGGRPVPVVQVRPLVPAELPRASQDAPLLVVHDAGAVPQELFPPRSPWQTTLYVLPYLHAQASDIAINADLVLLARLLAEQTQLAAEIWQLPASMAAQLATLPDDGVVALAPNLWLPMRLVTTPAEHDILDPIRNGD
jgi:hypothetical protein